MDAAAATPIPTADAGFHFVTDAVWDEIRADYLAGWSAPACCRRYGVGLSTLRKRAAAEGWRREDQPWAGPRGLERDDEGLALEESVDGDLEQIPLSELSVVAFQRMMRAVLHGKAMEALRWRRVHTVIQAEALALTRRYEQAERERLQAASRRDREFCDDLEAVIADGYAALRAGSPGPDGRDEGDEGDGRDGVFSPSQSIGASGGVLPGLPGGPPVAGAPSGLRPAVQTRSCAGPLQTPPAAGRPRSDICPRPPPPEPR